MPPVAKRKWLFSSLGAMVLAGCCVERGAALAGAQQIAKSASGPDVEAPASRHDASRVAAKREEQPSGDRLSAEQAKALALKAHAEATAMDRLPRFFYRIKSGNGDVDTMRHWAECSIEGLTEALDGPVAMFDWRQRGVTLAWTEKHVLLSDGHWEQRRLGEKPDSSQQDRVWTKDLSFERGAAADQPAQFIFTQTPDTLWEQQLNELAYFRVTPHQFWWATTDYFDDTISLVPPEEADYRFIATELFDGELCDLVESPSRAERLWIGRKSRRLRGVLIYRYRGNRPEKPFYEHPRVREIAGKAIASQQEYTDWYFGEETSRRQKTEIARAWCELYFDRFGPNELIRFRNYREIAPGVWIPFREDRAFTHPAAMDRKRRKYIRLWVAVDEVRTDVDLTERVNSLRPREGEPIQDQRFGVVINYSYKPGRRQSELWELVDAERRKPNVDATRLEKMMAPVEALVGKPAPALPAEGWIGGPRPQLADRPYLIHFWAAWSGPSREDLLTLRELAAQGLTIVGLHPAGNSAAEAGKLIDDLQLGYPTYIPSATSEGDDRKIAGYTAPVVPYCILIDRAGRVVDHGPLGREMVAKLRALMQSDD